MIDRGIIKWKPFESCLSKNEIDKIITERNCIQKYPILSNDQLILIEEKIVLSFQTQTEILLKYYKNNRITTERGIVSKIDKIQKKICFNSKSIEFYKIIAAS